VNASPRVGILALQGAVAAHQRSLAGLGVSATLVRTPDDLDRVEALVLPGGESTTLWHLLKVNGLAEPLADRLAGGMPALGTCAGMILLASDVLDGRTDQGWFSAIDITVRRNAFGRQVDSFECDLELPAVGAPDLHAVFIRAPQVVRCGEGVSVLANLADSPILVKQDSVMVAAFHPELGVDSRIHAMFLEML